MLRDAGGVALGRPGRGLPDLRLLRRPAGPVRPAELASRAQRSMRTLPAARLLCELVPAAREGLLQGSVAAAEADGLLDVISARAASGQTGAAWQRATLAAAERHHDASTRSRSCSTATPTAPTPGCPSTPGPSAAQPGSNHPGLERGRRVQAQAWYPAHCSLERSHRRRQTAPATGPREGKFSAAAGCRRHPPGRAATRCRCSHLPPPPPRCELGPRPAGPAARRPRDLRL